MAKKNRIVYTQVEAGKTPKWRIELSAPPDDWHVLANELEAEIFAIRYASAEGKAVVITLSRAVEWADEMSEVTQLIQEHMGWTNVDVLSD